MSDLVVIVPTRVRPHHVVPLLEAFAGTCQAATSLVLALDGDPDPAAYEAQVAAAGDLGEHVSVSLLQGPRRRLVGTLNYAVTQAVADFEPAAVAYLGDDHRPESVGWDAAFLAELAELGTGLCYGDDGLQGVHLPTAVAMTVDIPAALGYMVPPVLVHMYCDNFWRDLGRRADCITYLPDVKVIHRHPATGEADWDASYLESNSQLSYAADRAAYEEFMASGRLDDDVAKVRALRNGP